MRYGDVELLARAPLPELRVSLQRVAGKAASILNLRDCSVALYYPGRDELVTIATSNPELDPPHTRFKLGEGIAGHVGKTLSPALVRDASEDVRFKHIGPRSIGSVLCMPIAEADRRLIGVLTAVSARRDAFGERELVLLETIAEMAALSIVQLAHEYQLQVLNDIGRKFLAARSVQESFDLLRDGFLALMPLDVLYLRQSVQRTLQPLRWLSRDDYGLPPTVERHESAGLDRPRLMSGADLGAPSRDGSGKECCASYIAGPIRVADEVLGYMVAGAMEPDAYGAAHLQTFETLASHLALWLRNAELYERVTAQSERLEAVFSSSSDAILTLTEGVITRANPAAASLLGMTEDQCVRTRGAETVRLSPIAEATYQGACVYNLETKAGPREVGAITTSVTRDGVEHSILTLRDVTEPRRLDKIKTNFISMVSHELRTPLNSILGYSDILLTGRTGGLNEYQREFLGHIKSSSRHLAQLVNDILDLSRIDAGRFRLSVGTILPGILTRQVVDQLSGLARESKVRLEANLEPNLPHVSGDSRRIEQVLINLIGNALKFTPEGGTIEVRVSPVPGEIVFSVIDDGIGIPEQERERIFDRFYQPETAPGLATQGSGLGLTIAKHLVEQHNGRIWLESAVGRGSAFHFSLPATGHP